MAGNFKHKDFVEGKIRNKKAIAKGIVVGEESNGDIIILTPGGEKTLERDSVKASTPNPSLKPWVEDKLSTMS